MEEKLIVVVRSNVRKAIKENGCNFGSDATAGLNDVVLDLITKACERCKASKRKTVRGSDF